ncbi:WD40-repeat-containing domain protein [Dunaliella salina]|uniref:Serine-threonine kinase receptor-associated protein n=1 Tax=Dunaliella salina TaxID=3046 RepID=A0ABQ7G5J9_DUNSA|nr:WD40-repeat-containing domain protein [Dunaliella salina]|eukprot:KAF5829879.1 WD40-repeat-containing domain protein [Dunaliella salina]
MRPYLLKGHDRPLTQVKFNREGDLFVTCAKNNQPCLWWSDDGKRVGTFEGHNGAVWSCDMTWESDRLITASADQTVRIWDMTNGKEQFQFKMGEPCRACNLSLGEQMLAFTTDAFMGSSPMVHLAKLEDDLSHQTAKTVLGIQAPKGRITRVFWSDMNRTLVTSHDGGFVRKWDSEVGPALQPVQLQHLTTHAGRVPSACVVFLLISFLSISSLVRKHGFFCFLTLYPTVKVSTDLLHPHAVLSRCMTM